MEHISCLIIGSGPAGYAAAIYAARSGMKPVLYYGLQMGGQLTTTTLVENYPGFPAGIDANQLMGDMQQQAQHFGADLREGIIVKADFSKHPFVLGTDRGDDLEADAVIIATGATAKYLGLADEKKYAGEGVSACATCDGFFYRKKVVAVVGGGDTACEEASYLAGLASKVYMIVRKPYLRASEIMRKRVEDNPKIEILYQTNTLGLYGDHGVEGAHVVYRKGEADEREYDLPIDGFFLAIGHQPNTDVFRGQVELDGQGYIKVQSPSTKTSVEGVFAAGDVCDPHYQQAVIAAASGAKAAIDAKEWLDNL